MRSKKLSHIVFAVFAILLLGSMSAFAVKPPPPPPPVQTPLNPTKIPQFVNVLDTFGNLGNPGIRLATGTNIDISLCEYQTQVLPTGTPIVPLTAGVNASPDYVPGMTYVWGYQVGGACLPGLQNHSYLGPVVLADRHVPTQMTFINQLPDANRSYVKAYATSTDQTLIWGDPLSLNSAGLGTPRIIPPYLAWNAVINEGQLPQGPLGNALVVPEFNECWAAAQVFAPPGLPPACNFNYGFTAPQALPVPPTTPAYAAPSPAAVHIHGGEVPSVLDGGPDSWFTGNGIFGHGYYTRHVKSLPTFVTAAPALPDVVYPVGAIVQLIGGGAFVNEANAWAGITPFTPGTLVYNEADRKNYLQSANAWVVKYDIDRASYVYPNGQEAAPVWFHDHMLGATRLNVYAGIAGGYVITEPANTLAPGLHPLGLSDVGTGALTELTVPLIIQDRMFDTNGQLYFPNVGINPEHPFWIPEFVGDVMTVNGKAWPVVDVQPKRYKFLFLNGSNARSYELFLMNRATGVKGPSIWVIGNDQGYLDTPQEVNPLLKANGKLVMMPGERYEVIVDFSGKAGQSLILTNTAPTPYPAGANVSASTTGRIMMFRVGPGIAADNTFVPAINKPIRAPMFRLSVAGGTTPAPGVTIHKTRRLTLNEVMAAGGPVEILVNNTLYDGSKSKARPDFTQITSMWNNSWYSELPQEGETERWDIVNLTADSHPMHPHLVAFQVLSRQTFDVKAYTAAYNLAFGLNGLPLDGYGPPLDYNCGNNAAATARGILDPAVCTLGGNPDPAGISPVGVNFLLGAPIPPAPQEIGWKDTVMTPPGMITSILVRFAKPDLDICNRTTPGDITTPCLPNPAADNSNSVGYDFNPNHGHGYVWHCHIVDHEDNEMMRPFSVTDGPFPVNYVMGIDY